MIPHTAFSATPPVAILLVLTSGFKDIMPRNLPPQSCVNTVHGGARLLVST